MKPLTEAAHTPGPWVLGEYKVGHHVEIVDPISGNPIAEVMNWNPATMVPEEQFYSGHPRYSGGRIPCANAELIVSAPKLKADRDVLLTACEAAIHAIDAYPNREHPLTASEILIRAAIKKVKGGEK